jgi:pyruvate kinase
MKRTKIVTTIGPASEKEKILAKMFQAGMNVARLNFSHNVHKHHLLLIKNIQQTAKKLDRNVAIIQDLQGPRIRIGDVGAEGIEVKNGDRVILFYSDRLAPKKPRKPLDKKLKKIPIQYQDLYKDVKKGDRILIDDGLIELKVRKISKRDIHCQVKLGGVIKTHKGMNFPKSTIHADPLTKKDLKDLEFGMKHGVDYVALSFVRNDRDIENLRKKISAFEKKYFKKKYKKLSDRQKAPVTKIIAKIERRLAVKNFNKILKAADGIMIARGDLGIELPYYDVPLIQKKIIKKCNYVGKPVIVATQMLESMVRNPIPTRAEVSDVANAILDGTDAIMLSGESAAGRYPLKAVKVMKKIAQEVEPTEFRIHQELEPQMKRIESLVDSVAFDAQDMAEKIGCRAIICLTESGHTARMIERYKSRIPLFAFTPYNKIRDQLSLSWGVEAYCIPFVKHYGQMMAGIFELLKQKKKVKSGDLILVCAGQIFSLFDRDNFIRTEIV